MGSFSSVRQYTQFFVFFLNFLAPAIRPVSRESETGVLFLLWPCAKADQWILLYSKCKATKQVPQGFSIFGCFLSKDSILVHKAKQLTIVHHRSICLQNLITANHSYFSLIWMAGVHSIKETGSESHRGCGGSVFYLGCISMQRKATWSLHKKRIWIWTTLDRFSKVQDWHENDNYRRQNRE